MPSHLVDLPTLAALDDLLARSPDRPVILYKHSLTCGTSGYALEELQDLLASLHGLTVGIVRVQAARAVSDEVARRFGVRHQSPQVLIIEDGVAAWHASHYGVTAQAMGSALERLGAGRDVQARKA